MIVLRNQIRNIIINDHNKHIKRHIHKKLTSPNTHTNSNKDNDITKEEIDSWATDLLSNKVPDKFDQTSHPLEAAT